MSWTFKQRLIVVLIIVGIVPVIFIGIFSYDSVKDTMLEQIDGKLTMMRDAKKNEIDIRMKNIQNGFFSFGNARQTNALHNELERIAPRHTDERGRLRHTDKEVQKLYGQYDAFFGDMLDKFGLYDAFIVSQKTKQILYTLKRESDIGEKIDGGLLKDTTLAQACRSVFDGAEFVFSDMAQYAPSDNEPAMFIAMPLIEEGRRVGVFAAQVAHKRFNQLVAIGSERAKEHAEHEHEHGMFDFLIVEREEETGHAAEVYLVGSDGLLRTDTAEDAEKGTVAYAMANPQEVKLNLSQVTRALAGESGIGMAASYNGHEVIAAYAPVDVFGQTWALIVEEDVHEVLIPIMNIRNKSILVIVAFVLLSPLMAIYVGNLVSTRIVRSVDEIGEATLQIAAASDEIASATVQVAEGAHQQASSVEETSATLSESTSRSRKNVQDIEEANKMAHNISGLAVSGHEQIKLLLEKMESISESARGISKIIRTIDEIAFQTNILALNASVEAARAGEEGFGFAVVAEEIKNLSQRTAKSAKEIAAMIETAQKVVSEGNETALGGHRMFETIVEMIEGNAAIMNDVSLAVREQLEGMGQISLAMDQIDQVTQQNAASAEEVAAASEELNAQSFVMLETMNGISAFMGFKMDVDLKSLKDHHHKIGMTHVHNGAHLSVDRKVPGKIDPETVFPLDADDLKEF